RAASSTAATASRATSCTALSAHGGRVKDTKTAPSAGRPLMSTTQATAGGRRTSSTAAWCGTPMVRCASSPTERHKPMISSPATRQWLYGLGPPGGPILVADGVVEWADASLCVARAAAVLGTGTAVVDTSPRRDPNYHGRHRAGE